MAGFVVLEWVESRNRDRVFGILSDGGRFEVDLEVTSFNEPMKVHPQMSTETMK